MVLRWKIFEDFYNYRITEFGEVFSYSSRKWRKPELNEFGYHRVNFYGKDRRYHKFFVHQLVGKLYIPNPDNKPFINHKDGCKINNYVGNLEWVTSKENTRHAIDTGLISPDHIERMNEARKYSTTPNPTSSRKVVLLNTGEIFNKIMDASKKYNANHSDIIQCCRGNPKYKSSGKHPTTGERLHWEYYNEEKHGRLQIESGNSSDQAPNHERLPEGDRVPGIGLVRLLEGDVGESSDTQRDDLVA